MPPGQRDLRQLTEGLCALRTAPPSTEGTRKRGATFGAPSARAGYRWRRAISVHVPVGSSVM